MNTILFPEDVVDVIQSFLLINQGDTATQDLIIAIGAQLLDVSDDTMVEMCNLTEE